MGSLAHAWRKKESKGVVNGKKWKPSSDYFDSKDSYSLVGLKRWGIMMENNGLWMVLSDGDMCSTMGGAVGLPFIPTSPHSHRSICLSPISYETPSMLPSADKSEAYWSVSSGLSFVWRETIRKFDNFIQPIIIHFSCTKLSWMETKWLLFEWVHSDLHILL